MTKPFIKQVAHTCIFAHDLAATEAFYRDVFGIAKAFDFKRGEDWIGFYLDLENEHFSVYEIDGNNLLNEDRP